MFARRELCYKELLDQIYNNSRDCEDRAVCLTLARRKEFVVQRLQELRFLFL